MPKDMKLMIYMKVWLQNEPSFQVDFISNFLDVRL
jgi:hypothetical protein